MLDELEFRSEDHSWVFAGHAGGRRTEQRRIRVLIADDHVLFAEALMLALETDARFDVVGQARDGEEAVALVGSLAPDIVLMDYQMPVVDGIAATRRLCASGAPSRVVLLSGAATDEIVAHAHEAGAVGFVSKDRPTRDVVDAILKAANFGRPFGLRFLTADDDAFLELASQRKVA